MKKILLLTLITFFAFGAAQAQIIMPNSGVASATVPDGTSVSFYDSGGSGGNYSNNDNATINICPTNSATHKIQISFSSFAMRCGSDGITYYLDPATDGNAGYSNYDDYFTCSTPPTLTSTSSDGCISFHIYSNGSWTNSGWSATVSSIPNGVLPVEFVGFTAESLEYNAIRLNWITATEINNEGFEIERSIDGISFEKIAFVEGNGSTNNKKEYNLLDKDVSSGVYYYRLKQIDFDGQFAYSKIVSANIVNKENITVSDFMPNPTSNTTNLNFVSYSDTKVRITIYDNVGRKMIDRFENLSEGSQKLSINTEDFSGGIYTAKILLENKEFTRKLVVRK